MAHDISGETLLEVFKRCVSVLVQARSFDTKHPREFRSFPDIHAKPVTHPGRVKVAIEEALRYDPPALAAAIEADEGVSERFKAEMRNAVDGHSKLGRRFLAEHGELASALQKPGRSVGYEVADDSSGFSSSPVEQARLQPPRTIRPVREPEKEKAPRSLPMPRTLGWGRTNLLTASQRKRVTVVWGEPPANVALGVVHDAITAITNFDLAKKRGRRERLKSFQGLDGERVDNRMRAVDVLADAVLLNPSGFAAAVAADEQTTETFKVTMRAMIRENPSLGDGFLAAHPDVAAALDKPGRTAVSSPSLGL